MLAPELTHDTELTALAYDGRRRFARILGEQHPSDTHPAVGLRSWQR
jgi:hypothetical protein